MSYSFFMRVKVFLYRNVFFLFFSRKFKFFGKKVCLVSPDRIEGEGFISIGDYTTISTKVWLLAIKKDNEPPKLNIGSNCQLGRFNHIVALKNVEIGANVLIADKVYIADNSHEYEDVNVPILKQEIKFIGSVHIGENSWIGENASLIGARIGRHCIVGANSVVRGIFPDYCVIVGAPARIVKRYDFQLNLWLKTDSEGRFLN